MLWALGCTFVVLLYSLQFDLASEEVSYYDASVCREYDAATNSDDAVATTTGDWMRSIATSAALDVFAIQPVLLLGFTAIKVQWQQRRRRRLLPLKRQFSSLAS